MVFGGKLSLSWVHVFLTVDTQSFVCSLSSTAPQTSMTASPVESAQSILSVPTPWEATGAAVVMGSSLTTPPVKAQRACPSLFTYLIKNHLI